MGIKGIAHESTGLVPLMLLAGLICLGPGVCIGTVVDASGFAALEPVDNFGSVTVVGHHTGVLNLVSIEDSNKKWNLGGELLKCTLFPIRLSTICKVSGNTNSNLFLACNTGATVACESLESGVRSSTSAALVNTPGVSDHHSSPCVTPTCPGGGGCPDPPSEHGPPPTIEMSDVAERGGKMPLILAIVGRGAFAESHLALLYDDGLGVDTDHRLAFVSMPSQMAKEPRMVYSTPDLPMVFEAQYGDVETTIAGDRVEAEHLQAFFAVEGAYAVIDLGEDRLIGLADQIHNEDWYVDLKLYLSRYRHSGGAPGLASALRDPVTLRLATVFVWDGVTWVTDPLLVLEALSDSFTPSAEDSARLRFAVR